MEKNWKGGGHHHERYARRQPPSIAAPADVRGSSWETAGTKKETLLGPSEAVAPQNNAPTETHKGEAEGLLIGVSLDALSSALSVG